MELKKPDKNVNGFLTRLFRTLLEAQGVRGKLVRQIANQRIKLSDKDFNTLTRLVKASGITFKSFIWLLAVLMDVRHLSIRVTTTDKDGNVNEASLSTTLDSEYINKE